MRVLITTIVLLLIGSWICLFLYLLGMPIPFDLPDEITSLTIPSSTTEFGGSLAILNGLFSSLAVVLALIAVLLQGRELKFST